MARRCTDLPGQDPQLNRKRTADMLRQLRNLGKDARMLKARIENCRGPEGRGAAFDQPNRRSTSEKKRRLRALIAGTRAGGTSPSRRRASFGANSASSI